ncbi:MAG TPA: hypothetical protein VF520_02030 [Thermoleophilaceae bacterium]|jgi:hypothetical protein
MGTTWLILVRGGALLMAAALLVNVAGLWLSARGMPRPCFRSIGRCRSGRVRHELARPAPGARSRSQCSVSIAGLTHAYHRPACRAGRSRRSTSAARRVVARPVASSARVRRALASHPL